MDDFGLWDVVVSMFWFTLLMTWIYLLIAILSDIFRDQDLGGGAKAMWTLFIVFLPWLGAISYIFARGGSMNDRNHQSRLDEQARMQAFVQEAAGGGGSGVTDGLRELAQLRESGQISDAEYDQAKTKVLT